MTRATHAPRVMLRIGGARRVFPVPRAVRKRVGADLESHPIDLSMALNQRLRSVLEMSTDKFDIARAALAEFNRTQRASDFFADDFVLDFSGFKGWIEDSEYLGREGFDAQVARWTEPFERWSWELSELIDAGGDDIVAVGVQRGSLEGSAVVVVMPVAQIWTVRDGKLQRIRMFQEPEHAYRAAGLSAAGVQQPGEPGGDRGAQTH